MDQELDMSLGMRLLGPMLIWLVVMIAGAGAGWLAGDGALAMGKVAIGLMVPALLSLLLTPVLHRFWAQIVLIAIWTGFCVMVTLIGGLWPVGVVFLCIPAIAMVFTKDRVIEALILAAIALIAAFLALALVNLGGSPISETQRGYVGTLGFVGTMALTITAMIAGTHGRDSDDTRSGRGPYGTLWRRGVSGGLFEFAPDGSMVGSNPEGQIQFGLRGDNDRPSLDALVRNAAAREVLLETAATARRLDSPNSARIALDSGTASEATLDVHITPLASGGLLIHALDRTDDAVRIEALRRSQTVAEHDALEKTLFFAGVSHELRTPLNAIIGFSDMMRSRLFGPLPSKYAEYADLIHDSGQYMLDLIGDVLDLSKVEAGKYTLVTDTFDVSDVVRSSVKMIRPSADAAEVALEASLPDEEQLLITADRKALRQILLNLMSNAVKFSPKGGTVLVEARSHQGQMIVRVTDEGPGMSASEIARIGQPFIQGASGKSTETRGSGLGLSLVKSLAELHGGRLDVTSVPGEGTDAQVVLPLGGPAAA
ncbi:sensor histidine kinase [Algimonas porphyrae]|uniref:histidine kinase n=1 Tax=Algimonas porphyrae TaxID=1128113 RepID=A0ABQ5V3V7_9PROT|nr:HAMP domain-containing sensor histidine kinase [Algimonas porphyrae]GLQ21261.1 two-component sensor histidine kinase [Algimonas porphyrae]